jgi:hypothetical protein
MSLCGLFLLAKCRNMAKSQPYCRFTVQSLTAILVLPLPLCFEGVNVVLHAERSDNVQVIIEEFE